MIAWSSHCSRLCGHVEDLSPDRGIISTESAQPHAERCCQMDRLLISSHDKGAMGILTRTGGTIGFFGELVFLYLLYLAMYLIGTSAPLVELELTDLQPLWASAFHIPKRPSPTCARYV